jgi:translation initiation factor 2 subunit 3
MFVARSFDINKPGTTIKDLKGAVLGGSISQGIVKVGDEIEICPGFETKTKTKVVSLATNAGPITQATPGGLIAIGTTLDPSTAQNDQLRGKIIAKPDSLSEPVNEIKVSMHFFERMVHFDKKDLDVKVNDPLVLTIGTNTNIGFVGKIEKDKLTLKLKNPEVVEASEKIAISKNINNQWRLIAYGEIM